MTVFQAVALLFLMTAIFGYINERYFKLPDTIGLMVMSILFSLGLILIKFVAPEWVDTIQGMVKNLDFTSILMDVMLSFLLFAGSMHTDVSLISEERRSIALFALAGVVISTILIGVATYYFSNFIGIQIDLIYCFLFGALISPTDPIAVLGILTKSKIPKRIEINIVGESLFNDGVGVVIFYTIFQIAKQGVENVSFMDVVSLFVQEAGGGILFGLVLGYTMYRLLKSIDNYGVEVIITLAMVMGGYILAQSLHISGPLAMVVAGLFVGSSSFQTDTMSDTTQLYVTKFWELIDILMNAVLFVLIGLEILVLDFNSLYLIGGLVSIMVVLLARYSTINFLLSISKKWLKVDSQAPLIMTWGGLRGGLSIAMALSLPAEWTSKSYIVFITYCVVMFSIIVQGLTLEGLVKRSYPEEIVPQT